MTLLVARSSTSSVTVTNPPSLQTSDTGLFGADANERACPALSNDASRH
jgi:hypothetical protein